MPACNELDRDLNMILHESEQTSARSFVTRRTGKLLKEEKQMSVTAVPCASSNAPCEHQRTPDPYCEGAAEERYRLRVRKGLSGMKGNFHVPFLGEGARATGRFYPTQTHDVRPIPESEAEMNHFLEDICPSVTGPTKIHHLG